MRMWLVVLGVVFAGCAVPEGEPDPAPIENAPAAPGRPASEPTPEESEPLAPGRGALSGTLRRAGGDPIEGASVKLDAMSAQTDAQGHFRFVDVAPGAHSLSTAWGEKPCIAKTEQSVEIAAGENTADVQLGGAGAIARKTLVLNYDPIIESQGKQRLHVVKKWNDPKVLTQGYVDTLAQCSNGAVVYKVVDWVDVDAFPIKADGFRYTDAAYLAGQFHQPDTVRYSPIVKDHDLVDKVNAGTIDEVIMWGGPYFGYWESQMVGPTAYFVNSNGYLRTDLKRNFVIMGLNYERGLADAIHSYGHRLESIMTKVYGRWEPKSAAPNAWELFASKQSERPGSSGCGSVHFPPNGTADYDYGNDTAVTSRCDDYLSWPKLAGTKSVVSYTKTWKTGSGDAQLDFLKYWFGHMPRAAGVNADGKQNNWWTYAADFNAHAESR